LQSSALKQALTGQCLCGAIAYEINGELGPIVNCHRSMCRAAACPTRFSAFYLGKCPTRAKGASLSRLSMRSILCYFRRVERMFTLDDAMLLKNS